MDFRAWALGLERSAHWAQGALENCWHCVQGIGGRQSAAPRAGLHFLGFVFVDLTVGVLRTARCAARRTFPWVIPPLEAAPGYRLTRDPSGAALAHPLTSRAPQAGNSSSRCAVFRPSLDGSLDGSPPQTPSCAGSGARRRGSAGKPAQALLGFRAARRSAVRGLLRTARSRMRPHRSTRSGTPRDGARERLLKGSVRCPETLSLCVGNIENARVTAHGLAPT